MKIGIDFGTTNTLAAYVDGGLPRIIPNVRGASITPSVVGFDQNGEILVGESAKNQIVGAPQRTVEVVKRSIGRRTTVPFTLVPPHESKQLSPEEIVSVILRTMRNDATNYIGTDVTEAVVTVPAHYDDRQRAATIEAALLAGFQEVSLLNEPTAAALPYAERTKNHERVVVFDFGGGTLDVSCLERDGTDYIVQSTVGDGALGGRDIDERLYEYLMESGGVELRARADATSVYRIMLEAAERGKIDLTEREETTITLPFLGGGDRPVSTAVGASSEATHHLNIPITRSDLERQIADIVKKARRLTERAVEDAGFVRSGFDTLILSGGSSRLPVVRKMLVDAFGVEPAARINPTEVVATGAAIYSSNDAMSGLHLREALSQTLSIELSDGSCVPVIRKNQSVPASRTRIFTTVADRQVEAEIHLVQGDHREAVHNRSLGRFTLRNIETARQGEAKIAVTVSVDADGLVTLRAGDRRTGVERQITTRPKSESKRNAIEGDSGSYLLSLSRRVTALSRIARGDLRIEMQQMAELLRDAFPNVGDDMITVLETLILEVVAEQSDRGGKGERRAAS